MKIFILLILIPLISEAGFSKPQLIARMNDIGAWNAPDNLWCFSSEPTLTDIDHPRTLLGIGLIKFQKE